MQSVIIVILIINLTINLGLMLYSLSRPDRKRALYFTCLSTSLLIYIVGYIAEIISSSVDGAMTALIVENAAIPFIGPLFLLATISLFQNRRISKWVLGLTITYGIGIFCTVLTNSNHLLYYSAIEVIEVNGAFYTQISNGPIFYVQQIISILCVGTAYVLLAKNYVCGSEKQRRQINHYVLGSFIAFLANIINISRVLPIGFDPTPFALTAGLILFSVSVFRDNILDVILHAVNTTVESMADALIIMDEDGDFLYTNDSARQLFPELNTLTPVENKCLISGWPKELENLADGREVIFSIPDKNSDNDDKQYYTATASLIKQNLRSKISWVLIIRNTTDTTRLLNQLEEMAITDPLTGVLNRRQFMAKAPIELGRARRANQPCALIYYDIDFFKRINDTYGHTAGDKVLCSTANAITNSLREYDIFGRLGGEEFALIVSGVDKENLYNFTTRLRKLVEALEVEHTGKIMRLTASFGAVEISPDMDIVQAIHFADIAMYEAKTLGRNCVIISDGTS